MQPEDGPHTYAEYLARRRRLVGAIEDAVDEHALRMEETARAAVAHAAALIQSSHTQEKECLAHLQQLQDKILALQSTRRTEAAELKAFQQTAAATRAQLESELQHLRESVEEARREEAAVAQQQLAQKAAATQHHSEEAEAQLRAQTATVEARFQRAVALLQAVVQERKAWADAQCALCEERVREATRQAEAAEFSAFLQHAVEERKGEPSASPMGDASTSAVMKDMRDLEREMEELAAAADARMAAVAAAERRATTRLRELQGSVAQKKSELRELSRLAQETSAVVAAQRVKPVQSTGEKEEGQSASPPPKEKNVTTPTETKSLPPAVTACEPSFLHEVPPSSSSHLQQSEAKSSADVDVGDEHHAEKIFLPTEKPHQECSTRPPTEASPVRPSTATPDALPPPSTQNSPSPLRRASSTLSATSPMRGGASRSTTYHESTLVSDISCSFDAFLAVSPKREKAV